MRGSTGHVWQKLQHVAEPWTRRLGDDPPESTMAAIYKMASTLWKVARLPDPAERSAALGGIWKLMAALPVLRPPALQELVDEMYARARQRLGDDPRIIAEVSGERRGEGEFHVAAVSIDET
jgi:hypothetical protein